METTEIFPLIVCGDRDWQSGKTVEVLDPWNGEIVGRTFHAPRETLLAALDWAALRTRDCSAWPLEGRLDTLLRWADALG